MSDDLGDNLDEIRVPAWELGDVPLVACQWLAAIGQSVAQHDRLLEVTAAEALLEITAPADGRLREIHVQADELLRVGQLVARFEASKNEF